MHIVLTYEGKHIFCCCYCCFLLLNLIVIANGVFLKFFISFHSVYIEIIYKGFLGEVSKGSYNFCVCHYNILDNIMCG